MASGSGGAQKISRVVGIVTAKIPAVVILILILSRCSSATSLAFASVAYAGYRGGVTAGGTVVIVVPSRHSTALQ